MSDIIFQVLLAQHYLPMVVRSLDTCASLLSKEILGQVY
jgi:hypothetical protein